MSKIKQIGIPLLVISMLVIVSVILSKFFTLDMANTSAAAKKTIGGQNVYLLSVGEFENSESAEEVASRISDLGAAGYVLINGLNYNVISSMYLNENDANKVLESVKNQFAGAKIIKRQIAKFSLKDSALAQQVNSMLNNVLNFYVDNFILLDKNEINENKVKLLSLSLNANLDDLIAELEQTADEPLVKIKKLFKQVKNSLQLLSSAVDDKAMFKYLGIQTFVNIENAFANL